MGAAVVAVAVEGFGLAATGGGAVAFFAGMAGAVADGAGMTIGLVAARPAAGAVGITFRGFFPGEAAFTDAVFAADWAGAAAGRLVGEADLAFGLATGGFAAMGALVVVALVGAVVTGALAGSAVAAGSRATLGDFVALAGDLAVAIVADLGGSTREAAAAGLVAADFPVAAAFAAEPVFGADVV